VSASVDALKKLGMIFLVNNCCNFTFISVRSELMSGDQETELFKTCRCSLAGGLILLCGIKGHL
jgi:hypothetical protein